MKGFFIGRVDAERHKPTEQSVENVSQVDQCARSGMTKAPKGLMSQRIVRTG